MFRIEMLPAAEGDCLWIEYGDKAAPHRVLIDSGTPGNYSLLARRIEALPEGSRRFELFVVTHIDADHIGAAPRLLRERPSGITFGDVWFNGWRHLPHDLREDSMGEKQAEQLSDELIVGEQPWNAAFDGQAVQVPESDRLPCIELAGGLKLTLLSPYREQLKALVLDWKKYLTDMVSAQPQQDELKAPADQLGELIEVEALASSRFVEDDKAPNGSSIALLAQFGPHRVLLGADAFPSVIERSIDRLLGEGEDRLALAAFKVCHHGSRANTSPALSSLIDAESWLISTSGSRHRHPNPESLARLLMRRPPGRQTRIVFNYESDFTRPWADAELQRRHRYFVEYTSAAVNFD